MSHFHFSPPSLVHATALRWEKKAFFVFITFVSENLSCITIKKEEDAFVP